MVLLLDLRGRKTQIDEMAGRGGKTEKKNKIKGQRMLKASIISAHLVTHPVTGCSSVLAQFISYYMFFFIFSVCTSGNWAD